MATFLLGATVLAVTVLMVTNTPVGAWPVRLKRLTQTGASCVETTWPFIRKNPETRVVKVYAELDHHLTERGSYQDLHHYF